MSCATITLDYLGCVIAVEGGIEDIEWLREFLVPPFALSRRTAAHRVRYTADAERYKALLARGTDDRARTVPCFTFDQRDLEYPLWQAGPDETVIFDPEFRSFYVVGADAIEIVAHRDNCWPRVGLMRIVREIATAHAEANGALAIHGAAVALGDRAAVLAGPKRSGKTSLLFHTLLHPGAALVANDRLMLHRAGTAWQATGMPTVISVRKGTRALFPEAFQAAIADTTPASLSRRERASFTAQGAGRDDGALVLNPDQLCALAGVERTGTAELKAFVLPRVVAEGHGIALTPLAPKEAAARLPDTLFKPASRFFYTLGREAAFPVQPSLEGSLEAIAAAIPCFDCILGAEAYRAQTRSETLSRLLGPP